MFDINELNDSYCYLQTLAFLGLSGHKISIIREYPVLETLNGKKLVLKKRLTVMFHSFIDNENLTKA